MKKQILILTFFIAAIFAGTMNSYGQYDDALSAAPGTCLTPTTLTCFGTADALHPAVGIPYTYTITSDDFAGSGTEKVHWFVVDNADLAATGIINGTTGTPDMTHLAALIDPADGSESVLTADAAYNVAVTAGTPNTSDVVTLSWNYFDGQSQVILLVAYVYDAVDCTNNIEVYRIFPEFSFTLDIAAIDQTTNAPLAIGTNGAECVSPVESASYTPGVASPASPEDGTVTVDYGENYVYFMVNAANFVGAWQPEFTFAYTGTGGQAVITDAAWTYPNASNDNAATWHTITVATGVSTDPVIGGGGAVAADGTSLNAAADLTPVGAVGECIVVRVHLDYGTDYENVTQTQVTVTVDGTMLDAASGLYTNTSLEDFGEVAAVCGQAKLDDESTYNITPRPNIDPTAPTPFELKTGRDL